MILSALRLAVALLSVVLMVAVSGVSLGVWRGSQRMIAELRSAVGETSYLIRLQDRAGVQPPPIGANAALLKTIAATPGVDRVARAGRINKLMGGTTGYAAASVDAAFFELRGLTLAQGRMFRGPGEAVVGHDHAGAFGTTVSTGRSQVTVVGVLEAVGARADIEAWTDGSLFVSAEGEGGATATDLLVRATAQGYAALKPTLERLADAHAAGWYEVVPLADQYGTDVRRRAADLMSGALGFGVIAALLAGTLNLGAFFLARALDGLRGLGIRRAVGATRRQIIAEDVAGALRWALPGLGLGLPAAWLACDWAGRALGLPVRLDPASGIALTLLTLSVVALAAFFPARWAAAQAPTLALRGVAARLPRWQAVLTAAGLALGTAGLVVQANTARAARLETERIIGRIEPGVATFAPSRLVDLTDPRGYQPLTPIMVEDLRARPEWRDVKRSSLREGSGGTVIGTQGRQKHFSPSLVEHPADLAALSDARLVAGRWPNPGEVAMGEAAARELFGTASVLGRSVTVPAPPGQAGAPTRAPVVGVYRAPEQSVSAGLSSDDVITVPGGPFGGNGFLFLVFQARHPGTPQKLADWVNAEYGRPDRRPLVPVYPLDNAPQVRLVLLQLGEVYRLLSAALLLLGGAGLMAQLLLMLARRTKEIGVRRAVGASRPQVLSQFLSETGKLGVVAAGTGLALGVLFTWPVLRAQSVPFALDAPALLLALGVGVGVALLFGSLPATLATRIPPARSLREGEE